MFLRSDWYLEAERGGAGVAIGPFVVEHLELVHDRAGLVVIFCRGLPCLFLMPKFVSIL